MSEKKPKKKRNKRTQHPRCIGREWAFQFLFQLDLSGEIEAFEEEVSLFISQLNDSPTRPKDDIFEAGTTFCQELSSGVYERYSELDELIAKYAKNWSVDRMPTADRNLLRLALFELTYVDDTPAIVTINEIVQLAKTYGEAESPKFINGLLDNYYHAELKDAE